MMNIIKKGAAALAASSAALALFLTAACSGDNPVKPGNIVEVDSPAPSANSEAASAVPTAAPTRYVEIAEECVTALGCCQSPNTAQFVVINGRKIPNDLYRPGFSFFNASSTN